MTDIDPEARVIDLHAHTTASDGQHSPAELVAMAAAAGLAVIAVTDHDTTAGLAEALEAGNTVGVKVIPGIELSAEPPRTPEGARSQCHILGLFIDPESARLLHRLRLVVEHRNQRNARMVQRMQEELHWDVTLTEVERAAGGDIVARPHFAHVMVEKGYVKSVREAFNRYLGKGGLAYVERDRLDAEEAIGLIHQAGGAAVLAHPNNLHMADRDAEHYIHSLKLLGLDGLEARYNLHTAADTRKYLTMANRLGLATSGGSDFHGAAVKPAVQLGHVEGDQPAPFGLLAALQSRTRNGRRA